VKRTRNNYPVRLTVIFAPALLLLLMAASFTYGQEGELKIIYTGGMQGQLEPCGCSPKTDFGGLARIAGYLMEHKKELAPYILLDAGNFSDKDTPQGRLKAEAMLKSFALMKYDAVALSGGENAFPQDFFASLLQELDLPAVSGFPGNENSLTITRDRFNINVSADPDRHEDGKLNVLLTEIPVASAGLIKGWDVIISSAGQELEEPDLAGKTVVVSGYPKGKKLGILTLKIEGPAGFDFAHRWEPVGNAIKEDETVRNVLNDYDKKVAMLLKEAKKPETGVTYEGVAKCARCHQPFEESWKTSHHAGAFSTLVAAGKSADPECVGCHTVGFREAGGFFSAETTPELTNVQCEACHGPGRAHMSDFSSPMKPVTEAVCIKCHKKSNSPDFDYTVYLEKIRH